MLGIWDMSHVAGIFNSTLGDNAIDAPNPNFGGGDASPLSLMDRRRGGIR